MDTWVQNIKGQSGLSRTLFYTDPDVQSAWRDYVSVIVNRYMYSSAIFAWELANEVTYTMKIWGQVIAYYHSTAKMPRP